jgi:phage terminase small subunit
MPTRPPGICAITHKQRLVCEYMLKGLTILEAHLKAGYAKDTATQISKAKFFRNRGVQAYMRERLDQIATATGTDLNWLIKGLKAKAEQGDIKAYELLTKILSPELAKYGVEVGGKDRSVKVEFSILKQDNGTTTSDTQSITIPESVQDN